MRVVARRLTSVSPRMVAVILAVLLALTAASLAMAQRQADAAAVQLTVSPVDTVGYPYVDLVLGGVPGLGLGPAPTVHVTQAGQPLQTTTSWDLSAANPLAVVVDSPAATLAKAQGLIAELVEAAPPVLPLSLASAKGLTVGPGVNRNALMAALAKQAPGTPSTVADGVQTATAKGVQHILVVTTCASPAPAQAPVGIILDVLGIGPACTGAWQTYVNGGLGTFTAATNFDTGLAALDATVARWRSSVVVVTLALTRSPLVLSVGGAQITAALPAAPSTSTSTSPAPASAAARSGTDHTALVVGLVLFVLAGLLLVIRWRRRRPGLPLAFGEQDYLSAEIATYIATHVPIDQAIDQRIDELLHEPPVHPTPQPTHEPTHEWQPMPQQRDEVRLPAVIDLRADTDGPDVRDEPVAATRMAVAIRQANGHGETSQTAAVAELTSVEEPVVVAEQTPDEIQASEPVDAAAEQMADAEPAEVAADFPDEVSAETTDEVSAEATEVTAEGTDDVSDVAPAEPEPAPADPEPTPTLPRSEFQWTKLEFTPLVWRYDAEPDTIDLREGAGNGAEGAQGSETLDVRDETVRKQPRRRKARR
jgi:hypothetical protein